MEQLRNILVQAYGENEPVLTEDLMRLFSGISRQAVYKKIESALASGELARYDRGIYYAPTDTRFGKTQPSAESVLRRRWLINAKGNTVGYITGAALANETGLTEQVPAIIEVVTNTESTRVREVAGFGGWAKIKLRRPRATVTDENVAALRFLDLITVEPVASLDASAIEALRKEAKKAGREMVYEYVSLYPAKTSKRLVECEMRDVFA